MFSFFSILSSSFITVMTTDTPVQSNEVADLSFISKPIGGLFGQLPVNPEDYAQFLLSEDQIGFYKANGYLTDVRVLTEEQCDRILDEYKKFLLWNDNSEDSGGKDDAHRLKFPEKNLLHEYHSNQSTDPNNVVTHMLGHWRISPLFHDLVFLPAVTVPSSQLLAAFYPSKQTLVPVQFWHDQLFAKPPHHGGGVAWHQDYSYWTRTVPMQHLTVHIALDDQTIENGTVHYVPGSHKWHRIQDGKEVPLPITDIDFKDMDSIKKILTEEEVEKFQPLPSLLKKGHASFHHPLAIHGSYANRSSSTRRAAVLNYFVEGTQSNTDEPLLPGIPIIPRGQPLESRFFPLVFDPKWM
jgi:ectoine hydroxylase-related dioxygenase (phytanoyl-CoA dioxygenase family)